MESVSEFFIDSDNTDSEIEFELYSQIHYNAESCSENTDCVDINKTQSLPMDKDFTFSAGDVSKSFHGNDNDELFSTGDIRNEDYLPIHYFNETSEDLSDVEEWELFNHKYDSEDSDGENHLGVNIHITSAVSEDEFALDDGPKACWEINDKDTRGSNIEQRYFIESRLRCRNCNESGHLIASCPHPKKVKPCFLCGKKNHTKWQCPSHKIYQHEYAMECNRCGQVGHRKSNCPDLWRQFHLTTKPGAIITSGLPLKISDKKSCYNCAKFTHMGHECKKRRPRSSTIVISPQVFRYNHWITVKENPLNVSASIPNKVIFKSKLNDSSPFPTKLKTAKKRKATSPVSSEAKKLKSSKGKQKVKLKARSFDRKNVAVEKHVTFSDTSNVNISHENKPIKSKARKNQNKNISAKKNFKKNGKSKNKKDKIKFKNIKADNVKQNRNLNKCYKPNKLNR